MSAEMSTVLRMCDLRACISTHSRYSELLPDDSHARCLACPIAPPIQRRQKAASQHLHAAQLPARLTQVALIVAGLPKACKKVVYDNAAPGGCLHRVTQMNEAEGEAAAEARIEPHLHVVLARALAHVVQHGYDLAPDTQPR